LSLQIEILKKLKSSPNIVIFVGFTNGDHCQYLVTEWLEYGSLKEFYTKHKELMTTAKRLEFATDIARGLNFLTIVGIFHHDVRSENVFVGKHKEAKIGNFGLSREVNKRTKQIKADIHNIRYMAPELLNTTTSKDIRKNNVAYNYKCEVY
ncbi:9345_t:CDS:2, partial [Acaulospora morrowiae]